MLAGLTLAIPAVAAARIFVSVPGAPGESTTTGFTGQIEALSISFGYRAPIDETTGKQVRLLPAPITITKPVDLATPKLMALGSSFTTAGKIVISQTRSIGTAEPVFMTVQIDGAVVTDWLLTANESGEPIEQVTFQPAAVTIEYTTFTQAGQVASKTSGKFLAK